MKLHFNPGAPLNKKHCGSELAPLSRSLSKDTHTYTHPCALKHILRAHTHTPAFASTRTHTVSVLKNGY